MQHVSFSKSNYSLKIYFNDLCKRLVQMLLALLVGVSCVIYAQSLVPYVSKDFVLPASFERTSIIKHSDWQGVGIEIEHLSSQQKINDVIGQCADRLPALTPLWSEQGVLTAAWNTESSSYALYLWTSSEQKTEGLLSKLTFSNSTKMSSTEKEQTKSVLDWLPAGATQLFSMRDLSTGSPVFMHAFNIPVSGATVLEHLKKEAQENRWLDDRNSLSFVRDAKRISFWVKTMMGQTIVLIYQTDRDAL